MASSSSPKDKFVVNVINPYLAEVKKHPQTVRVEDGVLHQEDLKGPVKEGSIQARLEEVEHEVFKYKKMVERGVEANFDIINDLKAYHKKEMKEMWSSITTLEEKVFEYNLMIERGVEANSDIIAELKAQHEKEMKEVRSSISALEDKVFELQGHIFDLQYQNCEYELKFLRMGLAAQCRIMDTEDSCVEGGPLPWKRFAKTYLINKNKDEE